MKDYYTLKEVLLGLRNEQLRIAKILSELDEKMTVYGNERYKDSGFTFSDNGNLLYFLREKNALLKNALYALTFRFKDIIDGDCYLESIRHLGDGDYKVGGIGGIKSSVKVDAQKEFNRLIEELLEDDFRKNAVINITDGKGINYNNNLIINPCNIKYTNSTYKHVDTISYHARNDYLRIKNEYGGISSRAKRNLLKELLEMKFPKEEFSKYIQNVIDCSETTRKDILIPDINFNANCDEFYLDEYDNSFVLTKKYKEN